MLTILKASYSEEVFRKALLHIKYKSSIAAQARPWTWLWYTTYLHTYHIFLLN